MPGPRSASPWMLLELGILSVPALHAADSYPRRPPASRRSGTPPALGRIVKLRNHRDKGVADKARWVLPRALNVRAGKASMEEAIGHLAPLLNEKDEDLVRRTEKFLQLHTGQRLGRRADQWLKLRDYMRDDHLRIEAEMEKREAQAAE